MLRYYSLRRRGRNWYVRVYDTVTKRRIWKTLGTDSRRLAYRAVEALRVAEVVKPIREFTGAAQEFGALVEEWLAESRRSVAETTIEELRRAATRWLRFLPARAPVSDLNEKTLGGFLDRRSHEVRPRTLNKERGYLRWFFSWAVRRGILRRNPVEAIPASKVPGRRPRALDQEEQARFLQALESATPAIRTLGILALETGLRRRSLLALEWERIDLERGWYSLPAEAMKGGVDFEAPLSEAAVAVLRAFCGAVSGRVFSMCASTADDGISAALRRAGIKDAHLHTLRATFLSNACARGVPVDVVMRLTDHRSIQTVLRHYRAFSKGELTRAVRGSTAQDPGSRKEGEQ